jgi:hypothetical protein
MGKWALFGVVVLAAACGDEAGPPAASAPVRADRCTVVVHGKGGKGAAPVMVDERTARVAPNGNAEGWGGRQWVYFPDDRYSQAREVIAASAAACQQIIIGGFSNGAAFVAAMWCRGETFEGRLVGVVIDDPVPDASSDGCAPPAGVPATLYWTGGLDAMAIPGRSCEEIDWTCAGGVIVGIEEYAERLGLNITPSPNTEHAAFSDAPELTAWP